jgi:hypothetical protein
MNTLADIASASEVLSAQEKQQLMLFLADRLREEGTSLPALAGNSSGILTDWMAEDEAAMRRFCSNPKSPN